MTEQLLNDMGLFKVKRNHYRFIRFAKDSKSTIYITKDTTLSGLLFQLYQIGHDEGFYAGMEDVGKYIKEAMGK